MQLSQIHETLSHFLKENIFTDVSFSVRSNDGRIFYSAHKLILSMWSPVFANMCYNSTKENDDPIPIEDVSPTTFDAMLKFMYGRISEHELKGILFLQELYKAAIAYEIDTLANHCCEVTTHFTANENNVFQLLEAGKLLNCEGLEQRCYKILQTKTTDVLAVHELCNITPTMVVTILDMPRVSFASEYELISWVFSWLMNGPLKDSHTKTFKDNILPYFNFLILTAEEFTKLFQNRKIDLISDQEGFSLLMNIVLPGSIPLPTWYPRAPKNREYKKQSLTCNSNCLSINSIQCAYCRLRKAYWQHRKRDLC